MREPLDPKDGHRISIAVGVRFSHAHYYDTRRGQETSVFQLSHR